MIHTRLAPWQAQLVCLITYGLASLLLQEDAASPWQMSTTLRLAALLWLPCRYWFALLPGDALPWLLAWMRTPWPAAGLAQTWAALPPILLLMPLVWASGGRHPCHAQAAEEHLPALLRLIFLAALLGSLQVLPAQLSALPFRLWPLPVLRSLLDHALPALCLLPLAMALREGEPKPATPLPVLASVSALLLIAGLACWSRAAPPMLRGCGQLALLLPPLWMALREGWGPTTLSMAAAGLGLRFSLGASPPPRALEGELIAAFVMVLVLLLAARTSILRRAMDEREGSIRLTRRSLHLQEMKLRHSARTLHGLRQELQQTHARLLHRLHLLGPGQDEPRLRRELSELATLLDHLGRSLAPGPWHGPERRSRARNADIAHALRALEIDYHADPGGQLSLLPAEAMTLLSRLSCEMLAQLILNDPRARVTIRSSTQPWDDGGLTVQLTAESQGTPRPLPARRALLSAVGAHGHDLEALRAMARLFQGELELSPRRTTGSLIRLRLQIQAPPRRAGACRPRNRLAQAVMPR